METENNTQEQKTSKPQRKNFALEMAAFLWKRKAYWIFPVIVFLILLIVVIAAGTSPVSPFIYTII